MKKNKPPKRRHTIPYSFGDKHKAYIARSEGCFMNVAEGAVRAGKTVDNVYAFCHELKTTRDKIHLASASTLGNAKLILGGCNGFGIENYFRGQCRWGKYKGNEALIIKGADTGNRERIVIFAGGALSNSWTKIRGNSYGMWIATEINLHDRHFIEEALNRSIAAQKRMVWWDLNPGSPKHWVYTDFIDRYAENAAEGRFLGGYNYEHFTIEDNINVPEQRKREIVSQYDHGSVQYMRDILGKRIAAEGLIFPQFANDRARYIIEAVDTDRITSIQVGIDFGGNKSKTTFVATAFLDGFNEIVVVDDHKIEGGKGEISPAEINRDFIGFVRRLYQRFRPTLIKFAWADNEAQAIINGMRTAVRNARLFLKVVDCYKAPIKDRIDTLQILMSQGRFHVMSCCTNVISSLSEQVWDAKSEGEDIRLDDGTCDIDTADALEYSFSKFIRILLAAGGENAE